MQAIAHQRETHQRRRNFRLFEFLASRMSDAELRTMAECVHDELVYRKQQMERHLGIERDERETPHRDYSERPAEPRRTISGPRVRQTGTT